MSELVQARFDEAARLRLPPDGVWLAPAWADLPNDPAGPAGKKLFPNTDADLPTFVNIPAAAQRLNDGRNTDKKNIPGSEVVPNDPPVPNPWVNPGADFTHEDPSLRYNEISASLGGGTSALAAVMQKREVRKFFVDPLPDGLGIPAPVFAKAVRILKKGDNNPADPDVLPIAAALADPLTGLRDRIMKVLKVEGAYDNGVNLLNGINPSPAQLAAIDHLRRLVGSKSPGMKRLELIYEWALYRMTELLGDFNKALGSEPVYEQVRKDYLKFLRDLDDHQPELGNEPLNPRGDPDPTPTDPDRRTRARKSGYGTTIKWNCLQPVIVDGLIKGARLIIQWNPHSSSNGVPIEH
jgi:hypothetical protein